MDFNASDKEVTFEDLKQYNYENQKIGVIAHIENEKGQILLQQRGPKSRDENGLYEDIGGKFEESDSSFQAAIKREISEEAGNEIELEIVKSIGLYHCFKNSINWLFVVFFVKYNSGEFKIMEPDKCLNYKFFDCNEALSSDFVTDSCKFLIKSIKDSNILLN